MESDFDTYQQSAARRLELITRRRLRDQMTSGRPMMQSEGRSNTIGIRLQAGFRTRACQESGEVRHLRFPAGESQTLTGLLIFRETFATLSKDDERALREVLETSEADKAA